MRTDQLNIYGNHQFDLITAVSVIYMMLPLGVFFAFWFKPVYAASLLILTIYALLQSLRLCSVKLNMPKKSLLILMAFAIAWTSLGGAGHLFYANSYDWITRDAVLHDLVMSKSGVPSYGENGGFSAILRAPIAYYLPASFFASIIGDQWSDLLLWMWTFFGVLVFFLLLPLDGRSNWRLIFGLLIVVFFSGMDGLGILLSGQRIPDATDHIEWWAHFFQYSSNSTLLFWTPNHAIPGWIVAALFFRHWRNSKILQFLPPVLATLPLWSPFAFIGIAPFLFFSFARALKGGDFNFIEVRWLLPSFGIFLVLYKYVTLDSLGIPLVAQDFSMTFIGFYALFVMSEFGVLALILVRRSTSPPLLLASIVLILLPLFKLGPSNDLVMRASIPALIMICCEVLVFLGEKSRQKTPAFLVVLLILLIGAQTPVREILRAFSWPRWSTTGENLCDASGGRVPIHYVGHLNQIGMMMLFKDSVDFTKIYCMNIHGSSGF